MRSAALFLLTCLIPLSLRAQDVKPSLPDAVKAEVDYFYPGWHFVDNEALAGPEQHYPRDFDVHHIRGDFDGNGLIDDALHIVFPDTTARQQQRYAMLAFLAREAHYEHHDLGYGGPDVYLWLRRKGEKERVVHTDQVFEYEHDSIEVMFAEKSSIAMIYYGGTFLEVPTGD